ncbi:MAG: hypothetical protein IPN13_17415 [Bacteroidetes bacterium]|nr:hypothetical protein [Bacteroidota bacterium]
MIHTVASQKKAFQILNSSGLLGFITPDTFLRKDDFYTFRKYILSNFSFIEIIETGPVFSQVRDTWCCIYFIQNKKPTLDTKIKQNKISRFVVSVEDRLDIFGKQKWSSSDEISQTIWSNKNLNIVGYKSSKEAQEVIEKVELNKRLGEIQNFKISRGEEGSKLNIQESNVGNFKMIIPADIKINKVSEGISIGVEGLTPNKVKTIYTHPKIWITRIQKMRWKNRIVSALDNRENSAGMKTLQSITDSK